MDTYLPPEARDVRDVTSDIQDKERDLRECETSERCDELLAELARLRDEQERILKINADHDFV